MKNVAYYYYNMNPNDVGINKNFMLGVSLLLVPFKT